MVYLLNYQKRYIDPFSEAIQLELVYPKTLIQNKKIDRVQVKIINQIDLKKIINTQNQVEKDTAKLFQIIIYERTIVRNQN